MKSVIALFALAFAAGTLLLPAVIHLYTRLGKFDRPDQNRKFHSQPIPRAGGVAIFLAFSIALAVLQLLPAGGNAVLDRYSGFLTKLFPAVAVIFLTGLLDDWIDLRPRYKLFGQFLAACLAFSAGIHILPMPDNLQWLSFGLTAFWLILSANAFNLVDGSDGLAGSLGLLSASGITILALTLNYPALALLFAPLAGAIVPFLRRNWPPASVFMGDSGSLTIGFLIGCGGAALSRRFGDGTGLLAAFLLLALPLAEVAISATRRTLRGRSIFEADCQHLHHQFRRAGRDAQTLLLHMSAFSALAVLLASSLFLLGLPERILLLGFLAVLFLDELRDLAYLEFRVLGLALWGGGFQRWLQQQIELASLEKDLRAARSPEEVWRSLRAAAISLGVSELHLRLGDREWREVWKDSLATHAWQIRVDLPFSCFAVLFITSPIPSQIGHPSSGVAAILHRTLNAKRLERLLPVKAAPPTSLPEVVLLDRSA